MLALLLLAAFTCPDDQKLQLELPAWTAALLAAKPGSDEQRASLAALRFDNVSGDCEKPPVVEGVDVFDASLTGEKDQVVQVRLRSCKGKPEEVASLRIAVLTPLPEGQLCKLDGEELSLDLARCAKRTFGFVELLQKGRKVIQVQDREADCKDQTAWSSKTAFYEAQGWSLKKIFETDTGRSGDTGAGRLLVQRWKISYGKTLPKELAVSRCTEGGECEEPERFTFAKAGGKYVPR